MTVITKYMNTYTVFLHKSIQFDMWVDFNGSSDRFTDIKTIVLDYKVYFLQRKRTYSAFILCIFDISVKNTWRIKYFILRK